MLVLLLVWVIEKMSTFNRSKSLNRTASLSRNTSLNQRTLGVVSPRHVQKTTVVSSRWVSVLIVTGTLSSFLVAIICGYPYYFMNLDVMFNGYGVSNSNHSTSHCDVSDGNWVLDDSYPLYNASECPFVEQGFNCLGNGRKDDSYLKWKWKPKNCKIARFNVQNVLERLRSKRVVFVGDSMSRTQWESLICLLLSGVENKSSVYELNGNKITKQIRFLGVRFSSFNFTIEFFRSVFLVQPGGAPKHVPRRVKSTLKLDILDDISREWINSDFLIFNTGQWWVLGKLFDVGCYFQVGDSVQLGMSIPTAFRSALDTWSSWIETTIDANRTRVFFRTFELSHWSDQRHRICNVTQFPMSEITGKDQNLFTDTILEVVKNMTVPVTVLQITSMSAFRSDAHVGSRSDNPSVPDCSHWCLPGVPDAWNEIFLSHLDAVS